jgi:site-specific DNA recombinase
MTPDERHWPRKLIKPPNDGRRAVAYVRVSIERQGMISPELQMKAVSEYCQLRDYRVVRVIEDLDLSGRFWKTRQVDQAIGMLERGQADVIVVWRWSRVSRNRLDWALALGRVDAAGGRLESASEGFDTSTATGRFARGMLAEFAAFESDRMADVWREVRDRRVARGLTPFGHDHFGYRRRPHGTYAIDKKTGPILADLYRRYTAGETFPELTAWLHKHRVSSATTGQPKQRWGHATLLQRMDKSFAAGFIQLEGEHLPGAQEPLITPEEWEAYLQQRRLRAKTRVIQVDTFLLAGLVRCSCGRPMRPHEGTKKRNFRCVPHGGYQRKRAKSINEDRLHGILFRWLVLVSSDARHASRALQDSQDHAREAAAESRRLRAVISKRASDEQTLADLEQATQESAWRNPVEAARALSEDWSTLTDSIKRAGPGITSAEAPPTGVSRWAAELVADPTRACTALGGSSKH